MRVYFSAIGGVGIGPLALIAKDLGMDVLGSDVAETSITAEIAAKGIPIIMGQSQGAIKAEHAKKPIDWLVYSSSLPHDHPELVFAREAGIRVSKRDDFICEITKAEGLKMLAIAGTHGKTSTTGMAVWLMKELGQAVSYSIGTQLTWGPMGAYQKDSTYFVYECDEYDRNFLSFHPRLSLLTSVDYDHPDIYPTRTDYQAAFRQFCGQSEAIIAWERDAAAIELAHKSNATLFDISGVDLGSITLAGEHVRQNAWLAIQAIGSITGEAVSKLTEIMNRFPGTTRRFEKVAANIYSDYAHHPAEIRATLQMARELSDDVIVVYQPHQNERQHAIKSEYGDCFASASKVYWTPTYLTRENEKLAVLTPAQLISSLSTNNAVPAELDLDLARTLKAEAASGKLILALGAGPIDSWVRGHLA